MSDERGVELFETAEKHIRTCTPDLLPIPSAGALLKLPLRELHVSVPVRMDDGRYGRPRASGSGITTRPAPPREGSGPFPPEY